MAEADFRLSNNTLPQDSILGDFGKYHIPLCFSGCVAVLSAP